MDDTDVFTLLGDDYPGSTEDRPMAIVCKIKPVIISPPKPPASSKHCTAYCNLDDEIICQVTNITPQTGFPSQLAKCFSRMELQFNILDIQVWLDCGLTEAGFLIYLPDDPYRFKGYIATN